MQDDLDKPIAVRKGVRSCTQHPIWYHLSYSNLSPPFKGFVTTLDQIQIPNRLQEALQRSEWKAATLEELLALKKNKTWIFADLPPGNCAVECK